jgi:hypothetical protein
VSRTSHAHELVRTYLRELDAALRGSPPGKARELKEQIAAHLDDALPPDADDEQVTEVFDRLGSPAELAADVGQTSPWLRRRLARVSPRGWIALAVTAILVGTATYCLITYAAPDSLQFGGGGDWWYAQDYNHEHDSQADNVTQTTVPDRPGKRQGIVINIYNPTGVTQTVLGPGNGINDFRDSLGIQPGRVRISVPNLNVDRGGMTRSIRFVIPGAIPPHQWRELRVIWVSNACFEPSGGASFDSLTLRVRVGWFTSTEVIPLGGAWETYGVSHLNCQ